MTRLGVQVLGSPEEPGVQGWCELLIREGLSHAVSPSVTGEYPVTVTVGGVPASPPGPGEFQIIDGERDGAGPAVTVQRMLASGAPVRVHGTVRMPVPPWSPDPDAPVLMPFAEEGPRAPGHRIASRYLWGRRALLPMPLGAQLSWAGSTFCAYEHAVFLAASSAGEHAAEYEDERVELPLATIDRNGVCRLMASTLRLAFARCGLPYVRVWYYPSAHRSVLLARFDVDVLDEAGLAEVSRRTRARGRRAAFFVNLSGEEETEDAAAAEPGTIRHAPGTAPVTERPVKQPHALRALEAAGHELASHGYRHTVFPTAARCRADIAHSLALLRQSGADVHGYGAPGGIWLPCLQDALDSLGLAYSSELSCGFDGFPFWPGAGGPGGTLQVPVSPFLQCQLVRRGSAHELAMAWGAYCDDCLRRAEPASFILHTQDFAQLPVDTYDALLDHANRCGLLDLTFTEFARWWLRRAQLRMTALWDGSEVEVTLNEPAPIDINGRIQVLDSQGTPQQVPA